VKFYISAFFENLLEKIQVWLKLKRITGTLYEDLFKFFLEWEMFKKKLYRKLKHMCCVQKFFPRKSCRLWDNVGKTQNAFLCFHYNNGHANAPQCYVMRTLPILLKTFSVCSKPTWQSFELEVKLGAVCRTPKCAWGNPRICNPSWDRYIIMGLMFITAVCSLCPQTSVHNICQGLLCLGGFSDNSVR
jgi:hypothetical protein